MTHKTRERLIALVAACFVAIVLVAFVPKLTSVPTTGAAKADSATSVKGPKKDPRGIDSQ